MISNISNKITVFLLLTFLSAILITIYVVLDTKEGNSIINYNTDPLPSQHPSSIPSSSLDPATTNCFVNATECKEDGHCPCADTDPTTEYACSSVSNNTEIQLPSGNGTVPDPSKSYCLPAGLANLTCNEYTGKYIWSSDSNVEGWKCEPKYPGIFEDPTTGNTTLVACKNSSELEMNVNHGNQSDNKLAYWPSVLIAASQDHQTEEPLFKIKYWDPTDDSDTSFLLENTPYDTWEDDDEIKKAYEMLGKPEHPTKKYIKIGDPKFRCSCGLNQYGQITSEIVNSENIDGSVVKHWPPMVGLPYDHLSCHIDSCYELDGYNERGISNEYDDDDGSIKGKLPVCGTVYTNHSNIENEEDKTKIINNGQCSCASEDDPDICNNVVESASDITNPEGIIVKLGRYKNKCHVKSKICQELPFKESNSSGITPVVYNAKTGTCNPATGDEETNKNVPGSDGSMGRMCSSDYVKNDDLYEFLESQHKGEDWPKPYNIRPCISDKDCHGSVCNQDILTDGVSRIVDILKTSDSGTKNNTGDKYTGICGCLDEYNPVGTEAWNPCIPNQCQNNSKCIISNSGETTPWPPITKCDCHTPESCQSEACSKYGPDYPDVPDYLTYIVNGKKAKNVFDFDGRRDCNVRGYCSSSKDDGKNGDICSRIKYSVCSTDNGGKLISEEGVDACRDAIDEIYAGNRNQVYGYFGNESTNPYGKCETPLVLPGTPMYSIKDHCIYGISKNEHPVFAEIVGVALPFIATMIATWGASAALEGLAAVGQALYEFEWVANAASALDGAIGTMTSIGKVISSPIKSAAAGFERAAAGMKNIIGAAAEYKNAISATIKELPQFEKAAAPAAKLAETIGSVFANAARATGRAGIAYLENPKNQARIALGIVASSVGMIANDDVLFSRNEFCNLEWSAQHVKIDQDRVNDQLSADEMTDEGQKGILEYGTWSKEASDIGLKCENEIYNNTDKGGYETVPGYSHGTEYCGYGSGNGPQVSWLGNGDIWNQVVCSKASQS